MNYFGRRSPQPTMPSQNIGQGNAENKKCDLLQQAFLKEVRLVDNLAEQLDKYEMSLRESKKCLHALTDTMSELYEGIGPGVKEFRIAMEDQERLIEYKAHDIRKIINGPVDKFRKLLTHGKELSREREASKREYEAATDALRKLHRMGKGNDRRIPKMENELRSMEQRLAMVNKLVLRDIPLALMCRGDFVANTFPQLSRSDCNYNTEMLKVSTALHDIVHQIDGMYIGCNPVSFDTFSSEKCEQRRQFLKKYKLVHLEEGDRLEDLSDENEISPKTSPRTVASKPSPRQSQKGHDRVSPTPRPVSRASRSSETQFFDAPTRLFDNTGKILI